MEEHPLVKRFPDDTNWERLDRWTLRRQCSVRNIPNDETSRDDMIRLLQKYQQKHVTEVRKIPWRRNQSLLPMTERTSRLGISAYEIIRVEDKSASNGTVFRKDFTLRDEEERTCVVAFKEIPTCTCRSQPMDDCDHIMYLLHVVLNCPEPLLWQAAFLPSELEVIYRHSHAVLTLLSTDDKAQDIVCVLCFKSNVHNEVTCCSTCGRAVHRDCLKFVGEGRKPKPPPGSCWRCKDTSEWNIEKYRKQNQIPAATNSGAAATAATTTATIAPARPTPTANIVQRFTERKGKDHPGVERLSSSKKQDHKDAQANDNREVIQPPPNPPHSSSSFSSSTSNVPSSSQSAVNQQELPAVPLQRSTSTPLTSNQEPRWLELKQQKEHERVEKSLQGVSQDCIPALTKSLSSVPSVQYPIPTASAARARTVGQAGQTPVFSAVGIESHNSAANAAGVLVQAVTPVLPDGIPGVVDSPSPVSNVDADVHRREAARLVRKYRRLEKETSHIREHAEREIKKIDKEYKRKLKRLEEKRKRIDKKREQGLKKLGLKRERLEKELEAFERS